MFYILEDCCHFWMDYQRLQISGSAVSNDCPLGVMVAGYKAEGNWNHLGESGIPSMWSSL